MKCPKCKTTDDNYIVYDHYEKCIFGYCTWCQTFFCSIYGLIGGSTNKQEDFPFKGLHREEYQKLLSKQSNTAQIAKRQQLHALLKDVVVGATITDFELHGASPTPTYITLKLNNNVEIGISLGVIGWKTLEPDYTIRLVSDKHGVMYA